MATPAKKRKSSTSEENYFERLPAEIKEVVFGNLPLPDKGSCRLVCKGWKYRVERSFLKFSFGLCSYSLTWFRRLTVGLNSLTIGDISFKESFTLEDKNALQSVKDLTFCPNTTLDYETFTRVLQNSDNVVTLTFKSYFFVAMNVNVRLLVNPEIISLENLRKMTICISEYNKTNNLLIVYSLITPNLEELETKRIFACPCCGPHYGRDVLLAYMEFIARNRKNLRILRATNTLVASAAPPRDSNEATKPYPLADHSKLLSELAEVNLTLMQVRHITNDSRGEDWEFASTVINCQKNLVKLQTDLQPSTTAVNFSQLLLQNVSTLRTVHITHARMQKIHFDCAWIADMKCLVDFGINSRWTALNLEQLPKTIETLFWGAPLTRAQILWIGRNLINLKELSLRDNFIQIIGHEDDDDYVQEYIDLPLFRQIVSFKKLTTLTVSDSELGDNLGVIRDYCEGYDGLEWRQTQYRSIMGQDYFEVNCTVKIQRD